MPNITETARDFFVACETGKGWADCQAYCTPDASFAAQAEPLGAVVRVAIERPRQSRWPTHARSRAIATGWPAC